MKTTVVAGDGGRGPLSVHKRIGALLRVHGYYDAPTKGVEGVSGGSEWRE